MKNKEAQMGRESVKGHEWKEKGNGQKKIRIRGEKAQIKKQNYTIGSPKNISEKEVTECAL